MLFLFLSLSHYIFICNPPSFFPFFLIFFSHIHPFCSLSLSQEEITEEIVEEVETEEGEHPELFEEEEEVEEDEEEVRSWRR